VKIEKDSLFEAPLLLWVFSPALGILAAAPLVAGQLAVRLWTARMRRQPRVTPNRWGAERRARAIS
jgi:hypothetical protein